MKEWHTLLGGLMFSCPMNKEIDNCSFSEIRKLPVEERIDVISQLSEDQKDALVKQHKTCLKSRELFFKSEFSL